MAGVPRAGAAVKISARLAATALTAGGVALMFVPNMLPTPDPVSDSFNTAGPSLATAGFLATFVITQAMRWLAAPVGLWLVVAPLLLAHPPVAAAISVVAGLAVLVLLLLPVWDPRSEQRYGGGWRSLWRADEPTR